MTAMQLSAYGVEEMKQQEMQESNGGIAIFIAGILVGLLVAEMLDKDAPADFENGRQAAREFWS